MAEFDTHIIIGNHDTFYKNTNSVNAIEELYWLNNNERFKWYTEQPKSSLTDARYSSSLGYVLRIRRDNAAYFID
jgi:hypothetical protein